jgi:predicted negative regulator of RcsB-dependent stress response
MKKFIAYVLILLVLGGIFGLSMHQHSAKGNDQAISSVFDIIVPAVAYADSDTVGSLKPPPPPPPIW